MSYTIVLGQGVYHNDLIYIHIACVCFNYKIKTLISIHGLWNQCPYFVVTCGANVRQISRNNRMMIPNSSEAEKKV